MLHHYSFGGFGFQLGKTFFSDRVEDADDFMKVYTSFLKKKGVDKNSWDGSWFHPMTFPHSFSTLLEFLGEQLKLKKKGKKILASVEKAIEAATDNDPKVRVISNDKDIFVLVDKSFWYIDGIDGGREVVTRLLPKKKDRQVLKLLTGKADLVVSSVHFEALGHCITALPGDDESESS
jgi:hypothetical protein